MEAGGQCPCNIKLAPPPPIVQTDMINTDYFIITFYERYRLRLALPKWTYFLVEFRGGCTKMMFMLLLYRREKEQPTKPPFVCLYKCICMSTTHASLSIYLCVPHIDLKRLICGSVNTKSVTENVEMLLNMNSVVTSTAVQIHSIGESRVHRPKQNIWHGMDIKFKGEHTACSIVALRVCLISDDVMLIL